MNGKRIGFLDTWRAAALLAMIVWHFLYDLASAGLVPETLLQSPVMELARYAVAGSFIAISGVCARLSKRPLRRGLAVLGAALIVTAATYLFGAPVFWGILHLLGVCMLLYAAVRKRWERLPATATCGAALFVFVLTFALPVRVRVGVPFLFPLGLLSAAAVGRALFCGGRRGGAARRHAAGEEVRARAARSCVAEPPLAFYLSCTPARAACADGAFASRGAGDLTPGFFGCIVPT